MKHCDTYWRVMVHTWYETVLHAMEWCCFIPGMKQCKNLCMIHCNRIFIVCTGIKIILIPHRFTVRQAPDRLVVCDALRLELRHKACGKLRPAIGPDTPYVWCVKLVCNLHLSRVPVQVLFIRHYCGGALKHCGIAVVNQS